MLLTFLTHEYRPTLRGLIFVQTRQSAWVMAKLINAHPAMRDYHAFSFVGVSNPGHEGLFDFVQLREQNEDLEKFRGGELNLCISTSVLEEGIDVPAVNLVICFDERPNLRSFIQSRGRARQQGSKFVLFHQEGDRSSKVEQWRRLENEMKLEFRDAQLAAEARILFEEQEEPGGEVYRIHSTG